MKTAALGVIVEPVGATTNHHLALVGLAHIAMHGVGHHHHIHAGLDRLRYQRLQRHRLDRQPEPGHLGQLPRMARHHDAQLRATDMALRRLHAGHLPAFCAHRRHFALLDDVHPHGGTGARIAPGHRIMARRAAARLPQGPQHRIARPVDVQDRAQLFHPARRDEFGHNPLQRVGVGGALIAPHLVMGLRQHHHPARREHHVVIQILAHRLVQRPRLLIDRRRRILQIVGPDDRGVAPGIAAAQPAFLDHRDIGDAVVFAKIIGSGKPVAARTHDDDIIRPFRRGRGPGALPSHVMAQSFAGDGKCGIALHGFSSSGPRCWLP